MAVRALGALLVLAGVVRAYFGYRKASNVRVRGRDRGEGVIAILVSVVLTGMGVFLLIAGPR